MRQTRTERVPAPFKVGDRVRETTDGPGLMAARRGAVVAVRDEWPTVGPFKAYQAVEVRYDTNIYSPDAIGYAAGWGAIRPWIAFENDGA